MTFQLAACAETLWQDRPIEWRAARLHEMGFGVGLWNWSVIARALKNMGYGGPVGMEAFAKGSAEDALEAFRAAFTL